MYLCQLFITEECLREFLSHQLYKPKFIISCLPQNICPGSLFKKCIFIIMSFRTNKCTHGEKGMCIHCMVNRQKQEKINSLAKVQTEQLKCKHAAHMKCLRCLGSGQQRQLCNHPDYETCTKCQHFLKYDKFSYFLDSILSQCSHKKPCGKCLPPLSRKTFFIDKDCKKHLPYPQALCESCMAPTVTIGPQRYSHVNRVIIRTKDILYTIVDSKHIGILYGHVIDETIYVQGVYYPPQQQPNANYLDPNSIPDRSYIFSTFGLKEVGVIYRSTEVNGLNLMMSSLLQDRYLQFEGQHPLSRFVTMRLQLQGEEPHFQCFMVTDQFQAFHRNGLIYEKQTSQASFDLITARSQSTTATLPTFLREGIQTNYILFKQCIIWVPTIHEHQFCIDQQYIYPFFTIQNQTLHHLRNIIEQPQETLEKYRNIQFLLHLQSLIGRKQTERFLKDYYLDEPDLFLQNVLQNKDKQERQDVMNSFQNTPSMLQYPMP